MLKLSKTLVLKYSAFLAYAGEDFGFAPDNEIPAGSLPFWCDVVRVDVETYSFPVLVPYAVFISRNSLLSSKEFDDFYFFIHSTVYRVKKRLRSSFSFDEIAVLLYFAFEKHNIFDL